MATSKAMPDKRSVLLVEDDAVLRNALRWILEDDGLPIETAEDGGQAVEWLRVNRPALLVLDMGLPVASGEEVAAVLRQVHGSDVPILLMTADGRAREKAERVGARAYFHKPFDLEKLVQQVQDLLQT